MRCRGVVLAFRKARVLVLLYALLNASVLHAHIHFVMQQIAVLRTMWAHRPLRTTTSNTSACVVFARGHRGKQFTGLFAFHFCSTPRNILCSYQKSKNTNHFGSCFYFLVEMRGVVGASARCNSEMSVLAQANERQPGPGVQVGSFAHNTKGVSPHRRQKKKTDLFVRFVLLVEQYQRYSNYLIALTYPHHHIVMFYLVRVFKNLFKNLFVRINHIIIYTHIEIINYNVRTCMNVRQ